MAKKFGQYQYRPMLASLLRKEDVVRTFEREATVVDVEHDVIIAATVEVQLVDSKGSFLVGMHEFDHHLSWFIEVCCGVVTA